jgi:hypothetical protein
MFAYTTIENEYNAYTTFQLSASLSDGKYHDVNLTIINVDTNQIEECWDNENYLTDKLWPWLNDNRDDEDLDLQLSSFKQELLTMFQEAFKLNFFNTNDITQ